MTHCKDCKIFSGATKKTPYEIFMEEYNEQTVTVRGTTLEDVIIAKQKRRQTDLEEWKKWLENTKYGETKE